VIGLYKGNKIFYEVRTITEKQSMI